MLFWSGIITRKRNLDVQISSETYSLFFILAVDLTSTKKNKKTRKHFDKSSKNKMKEKLMKN